MKKLLISIFVSLPILVIGQTTTENYIKSISYQVATQTENVADDEKIETITYYDDLGRAKQSIAQRAGGNREDLVTPVFYDDLGRQLKEYLPSPVVSNNGNYITNPLTGLTSYYLSNFSEDSSGGQINPYSEKAFESSPLNRVLEQGAPGMDWEVDTASDTDHTIKYHYQTNHATEVKRYSVSFTGGNTTLPQLVYEGYYSINQLKKGVTKDENWHPADGIYGITYEFTNKLGQVILKRTSVEDPTRAPQDPNYHDTYYVYDDYGNLTYVIPPLVETSNGVDTNELNNICYQYKYDGRNRLIEKKIPGKGWEYIIYDKLDRPILTQDQNLKSENTWLFTKYDAFGRVAYTGTFGGVGTRESFQNLVNGLTVFYEQRTTSPTTVGDIALYYTANQAYPFSPLEVLTVNYYDDYIDTVTDMGAMNLPASVFGETVSNATKGLPTVSRIRVLDDSTNDWIISLTGYDDKGQVIYTRSVNEYLDTNDVVMSQLDFTGKPLETTTIHSKTGHDAITTKDYFTYDHMGRLAKHMQRIDDAPTQLIAHNEYDELAQLTAKKVGGELFKNGYTDLVNVSVTGDVVITKTGQTYHYDAGLATIGELTGDGGISFIAGDVQKKYYVGLNNDNIGSGDGEIDYAFFFLGTGSNPNRARVRIRENNVTVYTGTYVQYNEGDQFAIEREDNILHFMHNGTTMHTYDISQTNPALVGDVSFYTPGASISDLQFYATSFDNSLQTVSYKYNIRGWLTDINNIEDRGSKRPSLFNFKINYNRIDGGIAGTPLYNGNIAQALWKSANDDATIRTYSYGYDDLNRIKEANGYKGGTLNTMTAYYHHDLGGIDYDKNGNILSLERNGANDNETAYGVWDDLTYHYIGNQLQQVDDNATVAAYKDKGFKDATNLDEDYDYDANGNMTVDHNKGISSITYNHLNLPEVITINNGTESGTITYVYDATGIKLKKTLQSGTNAAIHTEYAGNYVYSDMETTGSLQLQFFNHPEGYVEPVINNTTKSVKGYDAGSGEITYSAFKYVFQFKDHLGNIRLSYSDDDLNGSIDPNDEIIEESNYYPFGLKHNGYNTTVTGSGNSLAQKWSFLGQERIDDLNLNWLTFRYRNYMRDLGRFFGVDPVSADYVSISTYQFAHNNPIWKIEIEGLEGETFNGEPDPQSIEPVGNPSSRVQMPTEMAYATAGGGRGSNSNRRSKKTNSVTVSPQTHNGKFRVEAVQGPNLAGNGVGELAIKSDEFAVTGMWDSSVTTGLSFSGGTSPNGSLLSLIGGNINIEKNTEVTSLMDFGNKSGLVSIATLGPIAKITGQDINHSGDAIWSSIGFNVGISIGGAKSEERFKTADFFYGKGNEVIRGRTEEDSIRKAAVDTLLPDRSAFFEKKNISLDSILRLEKKYN